MSSAVIRKTHPMVLIAAVALTVFSLLGSAAITGLIPIAHSEQPDMVLSLTDNSRIALKDESNFPAKESSVDSSLAQQAAVCSDCGTVVSIRTMNQDGEASGRGTVAGGVAQGGD